MEELIVAKAKELFFSYGIKSVSMDDISSNAAISKKTIYKSFEDKNQLVERLVADLLVCFSQGLEQGGTEARNAVEETMLCTQTTLHSICNINPAFFFDLKKFFPGIWKLIEQHSSTVLAPSVTKNLNNGIEQGLYRADLDIPFTTIIRLQQILSVVDVNNYTSRLNETQQLMMKLTEFYLHAITTPKGKKLITTYLNINNERQFSN